MMVNFLPTRKNDLTSVLEKYINKFSFFLSFKKRAALTIMGLVHYFFYLAPDKSADKTLANIVKQTSGKCGPFSDTLKMRAQNFCHYCDSNRVFPKISIVEQLKDGQHCYLHLQSAGMPAEGVSGTRDRKEIVRGRATPSCSSNPFSSSSAVSSVQAFSR